MKNFLFKISALIVAAALLGSLAACKKDGVSNDVGGDDGYVLSGRNTYPEVAAPYESESRAALQRYLSAAGNPLIKNSVAAEVAAELYAYACYNEEYIDKYVYFSSQTGSTDLGAMGSSTVTKQDYKLIIYEGEDTPGYKYHYTIKHVDEISGLVSVAESLFEGGTKLRFVIDTNKLYGFKGENSHYDETGEFKEDVLTCSWTPMSDAWGTIDPPIVKREGEKLTLDGIRQDIIDTAGGDDPVIHGNINILAEEIVQSATITEQQTESGAKYYNILVNIDVGVANADAASMAMLRHANGSDDCVWVSESDGGRALTLIFQVWDNGLFKLYGLRETWKGKTNGFSGMADSSLSVQYSYSQKDTDISSRLDMLEQQ